VQEGSFGKKSPTLIHPPSKCGRCVQHSHGLLNSLKSYGNIFMRRGSVVEDMQQGDNGVFDADRKGRGRKTP
jgi:hypothetical protein